MKKSTFLRTSLISMIMALPLLHSASASAITPAEMQRMENQAGVDTVVDGNFIWLKTTPQTGSYLTAQDYCLQQPTAKGGKWRIPDSDEVTHFYTRIIMPGKVDLSGWKLDKVWLSDQGRASGYHSFFDLGAGSLSLPGARDDASLIPLCVSQYVPNDVTSADYYTDMDGLTWSKVTQSNKGNFDGAQSWCANMDRDHPWKIPTTEQLLNFYNRVLTYKSNGKDMSQQFMEHGWNLGTVWSSTSQKSEYHDIVYLVDGSVNSSYNENTAKFACVR